MSPIDILHDRIMRLTYQRIVADAAGFAGAGFGESAQAPSRFVTREALERTRRRIAQECEAAAAEPALVEYLTTAWLNRFAPQPA